jgi:proteasome lid subunit RPN8/RPN11
VNERILVDRSLAAATAPPRVVSDLQEHARETHPEECCGLVLGEKPGQLVQVFRCRNEMTRLHQIEPGQYPRDGREGFHMHEADVLAAQREADARGWLVTGVYHSHADAGPYFSTLDQEFAAQPGFPFPEALHIVISLLDGLVNEIAVFERAAGGFSGRLLKAEAPQ